ISFDFKGLYRNGQPKAEITVEAGKIISEQHAGFRFDGLHYNLVYFDGKIFVDEAGVKVTGHLHDGFNNGRKLPVNVQVALDTRNLDWSYYTFTTREELETAPPEMVKAIMLTGEDAELPPYIRDCKNLQWFTLRHQFTQPSKLGVLPDWLGELTALEDLSIAGTKLQTVPESIARLPRLKRLSISYTVVKQLPEAIWQMPSLEWMNLSRNLLEKLPDTVNLPSLKWLDLAHNRL